MKLITKIYLCIGLILLVFVFVTAAYFYQSRKVRESVNQVLLSSQIIEANSNVLETIVSAQTGMRGYLLSGKENFLEPYYIGMEDYVIELNNLKKLNLGKFENLKNIEVIEQEFGRWNDLVATPIIQAKRNATLNPTALKEYNRLFNESYNLEKGKAIIDTVRHFTGKIEKSENLNKVILTNKLKRSQNYTDFLGIALTLVAVIIGVITALLLGNNIKKRIAAMQELATNLAKGDFDTAITDDNHDELSSLSYDMNVMAKNLQNSFISLNKINQELDQFAYVVSHDLKAPLRAINNLAEWIDEDIGETTPDIRKNLSLMRGRVQRLENLINGILAYARIGRTKIEKSTFDICDLLQEIVESITYPPGFQFIFPTQSLVLKTEKILLQQVLVNLISNAIKYNNKPEGLVKVKVQPYPEHLEISVHDNGPGIPLEFQDKIFGVFQTIEARDTIESTGIGLAIVKKIVDEKKGSLKIASVPGQGATFTFTWPVTQSKPQPERIN